MLGHHLQPSFLLWPTIYGFEAFQLWMCGWVADYTISIAASASWCPWGQPLPVDETEVSLDHGCQRFGHRRFSISFPRFPAFSSLLFGLGYSHISGPSLLVFALSYHWNTLFEPAPLRANGPRHLGGDPRWLGSCHCSLEGAWLFERQPGLLRIRLQGFWCSRGLGSCQ